jgi:hypothetical protein
MRDVNNGTRAARLSAILAGAVLVACGGDAQSSGTAQAGAGGSSNAGAASSTRTMSSSVNGAAGSAHSSDRGPKAGAPADAKPAASGAGDTTWCGVKDTFASRCTACHDGKKTAGAPMALKTYADLQAPAVSDKSKKVFQMVAVRIHDSAKPMPPQQKLTSDELSSIDQWIAAGAPEGSDPTCSKTPASDTAAASGATDADWPSNCDGIYKILSHGDGGDKTPFTVPAGQEIHPKVSIPAPWGDVPAQAIAWRSITDNSKVLHHWILYGSQREFLTGWAPGKDKSIPLPEDVGMNMPGGMLTLDLHYNNLTGTTDENDNSGVELCIVKGEHLRPKTATVYQGFSTFQINIPAHAVDFDVTTTCAVNTTEPVTLLSSSAHAHTNATHMKFTLERASGETIVLHDAPFDFYEQGVDPLDMPLTLNTGDKVTTTCTYSNKTDKAVTFGENTGNEMCFNFAVYYPLKALSCSGGGGFPSFN